MAELQKRKRLRTGHRASTTRIINQTTEHLKAKDINVPKLRQQETMLKEKLTALKELDDAILDLIEDDTDIDAEIEQADTWREKVQLALCEIEDVLKSPIGPRALEPPPTTVTVADPTATPTTTPPSTTASTVTASMTSTDPITTSTTTDPTTTSSMTTTSADPTMVPSAVTRTTKVRLPKITLRRFDGNPLQWTTFWDTFKSTVHDSPELTEIDKFNYLYSLLERSAAEAISGLAHIGQLPGGHCYLAEEIWRSSTDHWQAYGDSTEP